MRRRLEIQIDKNIPIPGHYAHRKYQWENMEPGDSFFVATEQFQSTQTSLLQSAKYHGFAVTTHRVEGGVRVWLIGPLKAPKKLRA